MTLIFHIMFFSGKCLSDGLIRAMMLIVFSANFPYDAYYVYDVYSGVESKCAKGNNGIFLGEMHRHMSHEEEQKIFFAAARLFWPEGCLRDFFGLKKADLRPFESQKNPENSPKAKTSLAKAKQVFLLFRRMRNVVH